MAESLSGISVIIYVGISRCPSFPFLFCFIFAVVEINSQHPDVEIDLGHN